jgi:hypothetical protein
MVNEVFPLLDAVDALLAGILPLVLRIGLWGLVAGAAAMAFYMVTSPQGSLKDLKRRAAELRRKMMDTDLEPSAFGTLARENIAVSLGLLGRVLGPALLSTLPVLVVAAWLDTTRGYETPTPTLRLAGPASAEIRPGPAPGTFEITITGRQVYAGRPMEPPTPVLHKRAWWNAILASPVGYLADDAPVEEVALDVEKRTFVGWLPLWAAGWETPFFLAVLVVTIGIKLGFRIA